MAHAFELSTREAEAELFEFEADLGYKAGSRTSRTTQRNPVAENKTKQKHK